MIGIFPESLETSIFWTKTWKNLLVFQVIQTQPSWYIYLEISINGSWKIEIGENETIWFTIIRLMHLKKLPAELWLFFIRTQIEFFAAKTHKSPNTRWGLPLPLNPIRSHFVLKLSLQLHRQEEKFLIFSLTHNWQNPLGKSNVPPVNLSNKTRRFK